MPWPAAANPPPPYQKHFPRMKNEIYQRGPKWKAEFRYTNLFLASDEWGVLPLSNGLLPTTHTNALCPSAYMLRPFYFPACPTVMLSAFGLTAHWLLENSSCPLFGRNVKNRTFLHGNPVQCAMVRGGRAPPIVHCAPGAQRRTAMRHHCRIPPSFIRVVRDGARPLCTSNTPMRNQGTIMKLGAQDARCVNDDCATALPTGSNTTPHPSPQVTPDQDAWSTDALDGKGPQMQPQRRLDRRLGEVAKAVA